MQLLAVKIGNSNIGVAVCDGEEIVRSWRLESRADKTADEYGTELRELLDGAGDAAARVCNVALVSVVPALTATFVEMTHRYFRCAPFLVAPGIATGVRIQYEDQRALGADRLVGIVGAKARYGAPSLLVDLGTATTFNAIDAAGDFAGGAIAPGLNMESEALHLFTAKLPRVEIGPPSRALARSTREALRSGIFFGYVGLIEGLVARLLGELGAPDARVIATGGLAPLIAPHCPSIQIVDQQLGFHGLRILFEMNRAGAKG